MFDQRIVILAAVLVLLAIELDGLTRDQVKEKYRCALKRKRTTTTASIFQVSQSCGPSDAIPTSPSTSSPTIMKILSKNNEI
jgi:hypothetical protein